MSRSTVNRVVLALAGLVLLLGGLLVLAGGLDLYGRLGIEPPGRWPLTSPDQPLFSHASRTRWTDQDWWWPAVVAGLSLLLALGLWWLFAQLRRTAPSTLALPAPADAGLRLRLRTRALEEVLESGAEGLVGVERARVRIAGRPRRLTVRGAVTLAPGGDPAALVERFDAGPLASAGSSIGLDELPAALRVRVAATKRAATPKHPRVI